MPESRRTHEFLEKHHLIYKDKDGKVWRLSQQGVQTLQTLQSMAMMEIIFADSEDA